MKSAFARTRRGTLAALCAIFAAWACAPAAESVAAVVGSDVAGKADYAADGGAAPVDSAPLAFSRACEAGQHATLAAVGDLLLHDTIQRAATAGLSPLPDAYVQGETREQVARLRAGEGYRALFSEIEVDLSRADLTVGNLEGPLAANLTREREPPTDPSARWWDRCAAKEVAPGTYYDGTVYSSYPMFNGHPGFAFALRSVGFDLLTTANNHALDRCANGVTATIAALEDADLLHVGTARLEEALDNGREYPLDRRWIITETQGIRIAVLAYAEQTNDIPDSAGVVSYLDPRGLHDLRYGPTNPATPDPEATAPWREDLAELSALRRAGLVDLITVAVHWQDEYGHEPTTYVVDPERTAREMVAAGADVILGSHPHVLQRLERVTACPLDTSGDSTGPCASPRQGLVAYSLGNFLADQRMADPHLHVSVRTGAILYVGITKVADGDAFVNGLRYLPVWIDSRHHMVPLPTAVPTGLSNRAYQVALATLGSSDADGDGANDLPVRTGGSLNTTVQCPAMGPAASDTEGPGPSP